VEQKTIACAACGDRAKVIKTQPIYASTMFDGGGGVFQHNLVETHYEIDCPSCRRRTQVIAAP
jgi:hypothetical protein